MGSYTTAPASLSESEYKITTNNNYLVLISLPIYRLHILDEFLLGGNQSKLTTEVSAIAVIPICEIMRPARWGTDLKMKMAKQFKTRRRLTKRWLEMTYY